MARVAASFAFSSAASRAASSDRGRAVRAFFFKVASAPLEKACRLLVVLVAAPVLGATAFGVFQFASAATSMMSAATGFGLGTWTTRALAREAGDVGKSDVAAPSVVLSVGLRLRVLATLPFAALLAVAASLEHAGEARRTLLVLGVVALAQSFVDYFGAVLRGREDFRTEATMNAVRAVVGTGAALAGLGVTRSLAGLVDGLLIGSVLSAVGCGFFVAQVYRGTVKATPDPVRSTSRLASAGTVPDVRTVARGAVREALPLWLTGLLATLYFRSDILFVRGFAGEAEVGTYAAAYRVFEATTLLPAAVMAVAFPRLVRARARASGDPPHAEPRLTPLERHLTLLLFALGIVSFAPLFVFAPSLVAALFGPSFALAAKTLRVLALAVPVMFVSYAVTDFVIARGRERALVVMLAAMLILNVGANLWLVPRFGGTGAAWSTLLTEAALVAASFTWLASGRRSPLRMPSPAPERAQLDVP